MSATEQAKRSNVRELVWPEEWQVRVDLAAAGDWYGLGCCGSWTGWARIFEINFDRISGLDRTYMIES